MKTRALYSGGPAARGYCVPRGKGIFGFPPLPFEGGWGSGGTLKRIRTEPGRQTYSGTFKVNILAFRLKVNKLILKFI